jgi:hypothetical protein
MKRDIMMLCLMVYIFIFTGCSSTTSELTLHPKPHEPVYKVATQKVAKEKLNINVGLLKLSSYLKLEGTTDSDIEKTTYMDAFATQLEFINSLEASIESILVNKGYTIIDMVADYSELTKEAKDNIDFFVVPKINLITHDNINMESKVPLDFNFRKDTRGEIICSGKVSLLGEMAFTILNPRTNDIIYSSHKKFESGSPLNVSLEKYAVSSTAEELYKDLLNRCVYGVNNARSKTLEEIYYNYIENFIKYFPDGKLAKKLYESTKSLF